MAVNHRAFCAGLLLCASSGWAHAAGFGNAYFFGDSLTDCCVTGRYTNSKAPNWADELAPLIGARYNPTVATDLAIGGAQSGTGNATISLQQQFGAPTGLLAQIGRFGAEQLPISSKDVAGIWIGTNDIYTSALPASTPFAQQPIGARPGVGVLADYVEGNVRSAVNSLVSQGFRNVVLISPYDLSLSSIYQVATGVAPDATTLALASQYSVAYRNALATTYTPGVNTYFFDTLTLLNRVQANPSLYGFDHTTSVDSCSASAACLAAPVAAQNRYVFNDIIHTTSGFDQLIADYVANMINARAGLRVQGDLEQAAGLAFSGSLLNRLDAARRSPSTLAIGDFVALAPNAVPVAPGSAWSVFAEGTYASVQRGAEVTPSGPDGARYGSDFGGATAGVEYRASRNVLIGAAFNYFGTSADLRQAGLGSVKLDSYQGGVFATFAYPAFFFDGALTFGGNQIATQRPGVVDTLTGASSGSTFTAASRAGYLFDVADRVRIGPIGELTFSDIAVGGYSERGDSLLTLHVNDQTFSGLTGGLGFELRASAIGRVASPFINLTIDHDFVDGSRNISSYSTDAPILVINTPTGHGRNDVYGHVAGGLAVDVGDRVSGLLTGASTFGRFYGDDRSISASLKVRL